MHFSVILPTIGRESLGRAIDSVIAQTHKDWTLYVVGDGVQILFHTNPQIKELYIPGPNNDFGAKARNFGIAEALRNRCDLYRDIDLALEDWIAYIDDDDIWRVNHLGVIKNLMQIHHISAVRTSGQEFKMKHKSPRSSKLVKKMGPINTKDILTVGMAHTFRAYNTTKGWQPCDNHDKLLWKEMEKVGMGWAISGDITFEFER